MRRSYYDFCVNMAVIERGHPHFLELKFCLIQASSRVLKNGPPEMPKNMVWGVRLPTKSVNDVLKNFMNAGLVLREHHYPGYLLAENGAVKITRPKIGFTPIADNSCWLEITPEIVKAAYKTKNSFIWLRELVGRFSVGRIVLSSVLEKPPSMRDLIASLAIVLDIPFNRLEETIKHNSLLLFGELYET